MLHTFFEESVIPKTYHLRSAQLSDALYFQVPIHEILNGLGRIIVKEPKCIKEDVNFCAAKIVGNFA